jgi:hypothetical protein
VFHPAIISQLFVVSKKTFFCFTGFARSGYTESCPHGPSGLREPAGSSADEQQKKFREENDMAVPKFSAGEMTVVRENPGMWPGAPGTKIYKTPVPLKEGFIAHLKRQPLWQVSGSETTMLTPRINPDNIARAIFVDGEGAVMNDQGGVPVGGPDMFGVEWVYVPAAGGSMVKPGSPLLSDANEWKTKVKFPDLSKWNWEESAEKNRKYVSQGDTLIMAGILNGYFERLISFMDFEGAALAMVDEDQQEAVRDLMMALADLYIDLIDHYHKYYGAVYFNIHDDWGSQMAPFFSPAVGRELIVPAMRKVNDHIHDKIGGFVDFHSCGHVDACIPNMIEAHWDSWGGMAMNDTQGDYEKYGDKIIIGVIPDPFDPATTSEEDQRAAARKYVDKFCKPGKPSSLNFYGSQVLTPVFQEELYRYSRIKLGGE